MKWINQWLMPVAFWAAGIAFLTGIAGSSLDANPGLRPTIGLVIILFGLQRFVAARTPKRQDRRHYGGTRRKPWDEQ